MAGKARKARRRKGLTERQQRLFQFIKEFMQEKGYPPTIREIKDGLEFSSTSVVDYNLKALEAHGLIDRSRRISRGIRLPSLSGTVSIPLVGRIVASQPAPGPDSDFAVFPDKAIQLTRDLLPDAEDLYALEVSGNSMIDALVHDGDIVVMKPQKDADDGEMVAVWLKDRGEMTLKRFYREKDKKRIRLEPANPFMEPIYIDNPENVEIQGKVVLVIRRLSK